MHNIQGESAVIFYAPLAYARLNWAVIAKGGVDRFSNQYPKLA